MRTKDGQVATYIQKPLMPLNPKEKPQVIIKRGDGDFETGILMYIGVINQKEMAGIQLDIRIPSECRVFADVNIIYANFKLCFSFSRTTKHWVILHIQQYRWYL